MTKPPCAFCGKYRQDRQWWRYGGFDTRDSETIALCKECIPRVNAVIEAMLPHHPKHYIEDE